MICDLCPRKCGASRFDGAGEGFCGMGNLPVAARVAPHFGEEPCISGTRGSGTVFFSGCTLKCIYCQNYEISVKNRGVTLSVAQLADCYKMLEEAGVHNINLVTADHFVPAVVKSFELYRPRIPVVYNCGGYVSPQILSMLDGIVDIYLPDFKYSDDKLAQKLSSAPDYVNTASAAIREMIFQTGEPVFDDDGIMKSGVLVRHLVLPNHTRNSIGVIDIVERLFGKQVMFSLMCQYVPWGEAKNHPKLNRKLTRREWEKVKQRLFMSGLDGFTQDMSAASEEYIPDWTFEI